MINNFLATMRKKTEKRIVELQKLKFLLEEVDKVPRPQSFLDIFSVKKLQAHIIAEIKFASPSLGLIRCDDPVVVAEEYLKNGASALSVLTESEYFNGCIHYLLAIRRAFPNAQLLMKDFIIDELQLLQAKVYGANAVLLIVGLLTRFELESLYKKSIELGLTPLVEVHSHDELILAEEMGSKLIGINNRNLQSLEVDLNTSFDLIGKSSSNAIFISESGIQTGNDIKYLCNQGFQGFLIGGHLMRSQNPGKALQKILREVTC